MSSCLSHRIDAWDHGAHELVARRCRFRLRRYGRSSFIDVRELVQGVQVRVTRTPETGPGSMRVPIQPNRAEVGALYWTAAEFAE